jgi:glycopeptide antibiotics resistance protein
MEPSMTIIQANVLVFPLFAFAIWRVVRLIRKGFQVDLKREGPLFVFVVYILLVMGVTLFPLDIEGPRAMQDNWLTPFSVNVIPIHNTLQKLSAIGASGGLHTAYLVQVWAVNILGNLLLLAPLGFLAPILFERLRRFRNVCLTIVGTTLCIEMFQILSPLIGIRHRNFDVDDLILNTVGGLIGYGVFVLIARRHHHT